MDCFGRGKPGVSLGRNRCIWGTAKSAAGYRLPVHGKGVMVRLS